MRIQDQGLSLRIRANIDIMMVLREGKYMDMGTDWDTVPQNTTEA